jgi:uncharacterized protein (DUF2384 family)
MVAFREVELADVLIPLFFNFFARNKMETQELLEFGLSVFNNEEDKFERWLDKVNISLGGKTPRFLIFSAKGRKEVEDCLVRIEYGIFI